MSAVSKKVTPASSAASTTAWVAFWSIRIPKLLQPRPTSLTFRPEVPSRRILIFGSPQVAKSASGELRDGTAAEPNVFLAARRWARLHEPDASTAHSPRLLGISHVPDR